MKISFTEKFNSITDFYSLSKMDSMCMFRTTRDVINDWKEGRSWPSKLSFNSQKVNILYNVKSKIGYKNINIFYVYAMKLYEYLKKYRVISYFTVKKMAKEALEKTIERKKNMEKRRASEHHIKRTKEEQELILEQNLIDLQGGFYI